MEEEEREGWGRARSRKEAMRLGRWEKASPPSPSPSLSRSASAEDDLGDGKLRLEEQECLWSQQEMNQESTTSGSSGDTSFHPLPSNLTSFYQPFLPAPFSPSAVFSQLCGLQQAPWTGFGGLPLGQSWQQQQQQQVLVPNSPLQQILPVLSLSAEHNVLANSAWHQRFHSDGLVENIGGVRTCIKGQGEVEGGEGSENSTGSPEFSNRSDDIPFEEEKEQAGRGRSAKRTGPREEPVKRHGDKGLAGKEPGRRKAKRLGARGDESEVDESRDGKKKKKRKRSSEDVLVEAELLSSSTFNSGSSSREFVDDEKVAQKPVSKKGRTGGPDQSLTWTDESVKFLFRSYDAIHQRLWHESNGQVKYQKKWTPILKAMQEKFGKQFSKKQCQSKYWSVRRECSDYMYLSAKIARSEPSWNPSIAGRELLKPKFYDVWYEVSGKNLSTVGRHEVANDMKRPIVNKTTEDEYLNLDLKGDLGGLDARFQTGIDDAKELALLPTALKHFNKDRGKSTGLNCMQTLMKAQLQASEKREEAMKYRAELMMELLTQHMEHVEKRAATAEDSRRPQLCVLERVNDKLEKLLDGFSLLNQNIAAAISRKFSDDPEHMMSR